ncbi:hypothetical protein J6590_045821 [Homalodisca vitripennis]|nr:hypothetical protein J6590_045821 [Homalodisca vitripennis]
MTGVTHDLYMKDDAAIPRCGNSATSVEHALFIHNNTGAAHLNIVRSSGPVIGFAKGLSLVGLEKCDFYRSAPPLDMSKTN